jgi:transposase-like protein
VQQFAKECPVATRKSSKKQCRTRRNFTSEFKADVVRLCREGGENPKDVSERLDLTESAVRKWIKQAKVDAVGGTTEVLSSVEREELQQLRRDNKRLQMERDILKKAATFFAKENS